jgi:hypothetical protein
MPSSDWHPLDVPWFCERLIVLCVPSADRIVAMSYEGLHDIRLLTDVTVTTDKSHAEDYQLYDADRLTMTVDGKPYPAMGLHGGSPFPTTADGLSVVSDAEANTVVMKDREGDAVLTLDTSDHPPGWLAASFSADGLLFVVGTPDALWCWRRIQPGAADRS